MTGCALQAATVNRDLAGPVALVTKTSPWVPDPSQVACVTRRDLRVFEPLVQVEHAWGLCLRSLAWLM